MRQGHTPYGYRIVNGIAVIKEEEATKVRKLYDGYLNGLSLMEAAKQAGMKLYHASAGRMMRNSHYLGDDYYPTIIDRATFDAAEKEHQKRADKRRRIQKFHIPEKVVSAEFRFGLMKEKYDNPFRQAEYIYSCIETKEAL